MATQWYWRNGDETVGPVSFQELAGMVRDHLLNEDDLVRPEYDHDWQTTDNVVGLYYMAQRVPVPRPEPPPPELPVEVVSAEDAISDDDFEGMLALADKITDEDDVGPGGDSEYTFPRGSLVDLIGGIPDRPVEVPFRIAMMRRTREWVLRHKVIAIASAVMMVIGGGWSAFGVSQPPDARRYAEFQQILESIRQQRARPTPDFSEVRTRMDRIARDYPDILLREGAGRHQPVKQTMLFVTRDILPEMLKTDLTKESIAERHLASRLYEIGQELGM